MSRVGACWVEVMGGIRRNYPLSRREMGGEVAGILFLSGSNIFSMQNLFDHAEYHNIE